MNTRPWPALCQESWVQLHVSLDGRASDAVAPLKGCSRIRQALGKSQGNGKLAVSQAITESAGGPDFSEFLWFFCLISGNELPSGVSDSGDKE